MRPAYKPGRPRRAIMFNIVDGRFMDKTAIVSNVTRTGIMVVYADPIAPQPGMKLFHMSWGYSSSRNVLNPPELGLITNPANVTLKHIYIFLYVLFF